MNELSYKDIEGLLNRGDLKFYNFYNSDIDINSYLSSSHYIANPKDSDETAPQKISTIFLDIEVYHEDRDLKFEFDKSEHPINSITVYNTRDNCYKTFFLIRPIIEGKLNLDLSYYNKFLIDEEYNDGSETIEIFTFTDELQLIDACWSYIRESEIFVLSGFNSDFFDYPYMYRRLLKLLNNNKHEVAKYFSQFGFVEFRNERLKIPDYPICDLLYLYKPRDEGGLSLGQTLSSYSLDAVSEVELELNKIEFKNKVSDYSRFYEENPTDFLLYNIVDVALCKLLNNKLKHIDQQNSSRRIMKIPFSSSMIGSSSLFEGYTLFKLSEKSERVRHGLVAQNNKTITAEELKSVKRPNTAKNDIIPIDIKAREYSKVVCKFDGAYVKEPTAKIIIGTIIDLDAARLYPSKIIESNIGFDTYRARVINTNVYKLLQQLELHLGVKELPDMLYFNIFQLIEKYCTTNKKKIENQLKFKRQTYFTIMYLLKRLVESNVQIKDIYDPKTDEHNYLLLFYLLPLLDVFNNLHPNREAHNPFIFDTIFKPDHEVKASYPLLYVIDNAGGSNAKIIKMNTSECHEFLNNYSYTICGTCFDKHEKNIGIFSGMLLDLDLLRKSIRAKLKDYDEGTVEYDFFNNGQLAVKRNSNSSYGVFGLSSFRYSNHWLAQSITSQGRLTIKIAQHLTENYLLQNYEAENN